GPVPCFPAVPSLRRTFPSGENLITCSPLPFLAWKSAAQTFPSLSTAIPCALANSPAPKFFSVLPSGPSSKIGALVDAEQPSAPQRSNAQILSCASTVTAFTGAHGLGVCAHAFTIWYGFGASLTHG